MERILHPEWRAANEPTRYPFHEAATLQSTDGLVLPVDVFLDASFYVIGGLAGLYLTRVDVAHDEVTLVIGDARDKARATGSFPVAGTDDPVVFVDALGRPAGVVISEAIRLAALASWGVGSHTFEAKATEFAATVCLPTPEPGLRGILLDDGTLFTGNVWLVGDDGVVIREEGGSIRVDAVGDVLFRRRLCTTPGLFTTPLPLRSLRVVDNLGEFTCTPGADGNIALVVSTDLAADTVLRLLATGTNRIEISAVGQGL